MQKMTWRQRYIQRQKREAEERICRNLKRTQVPCYIRPHIFESVLKASAKRLADLSITIKYRRKKHGETNESEEF